MPRFTKRPYTVTADLVTWPDGEKRWRVTETYKDKDASTTYYKTPEMFACMFDPADADARAMMEGV